MYEQAKFIDGFSFFDDRGTLKGVNGFSFKDIKRFYQINPENASVIRAWQAHKIEHKYFYVAKGCFLIGWVKIDDFENPSPI